MEYAIRAASNNKSDWCPGFRRLDPPGTHGEQVLRREHHAGLGDGTVTNRGQVLPCTR